MLTILISTYLCLTLSSWITEPPERDGVEVWNTPVVPQKIITLKKKIKKYVSPPQGMQRRPGTLVLPNTVCHMFLQKESSTMEVEGMEWKTQELGWKSINLSRNLTCWMYLHYTAVVLFLSNGGGF